MGYVVKHVPLQGFLSDAYNRVVATTQAVTSTVRANVTPPKFPVAPRRPPFRHPTLPRLSPPPAPNNPFRRSQSPAPTQPGAGTWDGYWGGKASEILNFKTAITVAGETGMPDAAACAMILDNYIMGDLSLGAVLYDALVSSYNASAKEFQQATKVIRDVVKQSKDWVLRGLVQPPGGPTGGGGGANVVPTGAHDDNSVPGPGGGPLPGETNALPYGVQATPTGQLIPGIPNLALAGGAVALAAVLLMWRK